MGLPEAALVAEAAAAAEAGTVIVMVVEAAATAEAAAAAVAVEAVAAAGVAVVIAVEVAAASAAVLLINSCQLVGRSTAAAADAGIAAEGGVGLASMLPLVLVVTAVGLAQATRMVAGMLCKERCTACTCRMASVTAGFKQCLQAAVAEAAVAGAAVGVEGVRSRKQE
jgi:hypothetical protein